MTHARHTHRLTFHLLDLQILRRPTVPPELLSPVNVLTVVIKVNLGCVFVPVWFRLFMTVILSVSSP